MAFSDPTQVLESVGLHEGMTVADLGAGSGFYTLAAAKIVVGGKVYAIDVQADILARLKNAAHEAHLNNVEVVHADMETVGGTPIRDRAVDIALVCNVLFQIEKKEDFIKEVKRILKPEGRVLVVDWTESFGGMGPTQGMVVNLDAARALFTAQGFVEVSTIQAGANHYGVIFRKTLS